MRERVKCVKCTRMISTRHVVNMHVFTNTCEEKERVDVVTVFKNGEF